MRGCGRATLAALPLRSYPAGPDQPPDLMSPTPKTASDSTNWRLGFLALRPGVMPCPGFTIEKWREIHEKGLAFLDGHADEAARLGWTTLQLF